MGINPRKMIGRWIGPLRDYPFGFTTSTISEDKIRPLAELISRQRPWQSEEQNWRAAKDAISRAPLGIWMIKLGGEKAKSGWDWLDLSIKISIPLLIVIISIFYNWTSSERDERKLFSQRQDDIVGNFIRGMKPLLLDYNLAKSPPGAEVRGVSRAIILSSLAQLTPEGYPFTSPYAAPWPWRSTYIQPIHHKAIIIDFLLDAGLNNDSTKPIDLRGASLEGAPLHGRKLAGADMSFASIRSAVLSQADLRGADLKGSTLSSAFLHNAKLVGADLRRAVLNNADLRSADLREANLDGAKLFYSDLANADFRGASLSGAGLTGSTLVDSDFRGADLSDSYLHSTDLRGADFSTAVMLRVGLYGAKWDYATRWPVSRFSCSVPWLGRAA